MFLAVVMWLNPVGMSAEIMGTQHKYGGSAYKHGKMFADMGSVLVGSHSVSFGRNVLCARSISR